MRTFLYLFFSLYIFSSPTAAAATGCPVETPSSEDMADTLSLTKVYAKPESGENEWIEIENTGTETIDLSYFTLEDATGNPWTLNGTLEANDQVKVSGFPFKLNDSGDTVILRNLEGEVIDEWTFGTSTLGIALDRNEIEETEEVEEEIEGTQEEWSPASPEKWLSFSEAFPNPEGRDDDLEWIELVNLESETLSLSGLFLDDEEGGSSPHELSGTLEPGDFLLIPIDESQLSLKNSGEVIRLLDINDEVLWEIAYGEAPEGESYILVDEEGTWTNQPTPGESNLESYDEIVEEIESATSNEEDTSYQDGNLSEDIEITEAFPNPEGNDAEEWIELTNGGTEAVNLGNWTIDDGEGGSDPYTIPDDIVLAPGESIIFYREESKITLNNGEESLRLFDFKGDLMDEVEYEEAYEGQSYSQIQVVSMNTTQASQTMVLPESSEIWAWSSPTPGQNNPVWKEYTGKVLSYENSALRISDGFSEWDFKANNDPNYNLLFQPGNEVLVRAEEASDERIIKYGELLHIAEENVNKKLASAWFILAPISLGALGFLYHYYKKHPKIDFSQV